MKSDSDRLDDGASTPSVLSCFARPDGKHTSRLPPYGQVPIPFYKPPRMPVRSMPGI